MANEQNLKPLGDTDRTKSEQRAIQRAGGIASGASRRKKKAMRSVLSAMLTAPAPADAVEKLKDFGINEEDADLQAALLASLIQQAMKGKVMALQTVAELTRDNAFAKAREDEIKLRRAELKQRAHEHEVMAELRREELALKREQMQSQIEHDDNDWGAAVEQAYHYDASREEGFE